MIVEHFFARVKPFSGRLGVEIFYNQRGSDARMKGEDSRLEIGKRMKQAAKSAGMSSAAIGRIVGVEDGTVRGWWRGRGQPDPSKLAAYAEAVRCSADYLLTGEGPSATLDAWHHRFADLVLRGMGADEALIVATQGQVKISPEDQRRLRDSTPGIRADLEKGSGGKFERLSPEEQQQIFAEIDRLAERGSAP